MKVFWLIAILIGCGCDKKAPEPEAVFTKDGKVVTDLKGDGTAAFEVRGNGIVPESARALHEKGRAAGMKGDYTEALRLFAEASVAAPTWAYPLYDSAYTHLLKGDFTNALALYRKVDAAEPGGFFTAKTAVWTLEREEQGIFPRGTYAKYLALESAGEDMTKLVDALVASVSNYPPALKEKALLLDNERDKLKVIDQALALNPDGETYGILMLNRALLLREKNAPAAKAIVNALLAETNTIATRALARRVLKDW